LSVSQDALLEALHVQPAGLVTLTLPLPAVDPADWVFAESVVVHDCAACVTVNVPPAIVIVPVRADCAVLAAML
jgi:hypothetical protein